MNYVLKTAPALILISKFIIKICIMHLYYSININQPPTALENIFLIASFIPLFILPLLFLNIERTQCVKP